MTNTDTSPMNDPQVLAMLDNLRQLSAQIKEIDNELGTDATGAVAQRNSIAKKYVEQYGSDENFKGFIEKVIDYVGKQKDNPALLAAVVYALNDRVSKDFGKTVKDHLDAEVAKLPKQETPTISDDKKATLANERAKKVGIFKAQKDMLKFYDVLTLPTDIEEPAVRRGAIGPRGAAFTKTYQYYFDGKLQQLTDTDTNEKTDATLSNIATSKLKKDLGWNTKQLRDFIIKELNLTVNEKTNEVDLPDTWEVTLPMPVGKKLRGVVVSSENASVNENEDDDEVNGTESDSGEDMFASA